MLELIKLYNEIPSGVSAIILTLLGGLLVNTIPKGVHAWYKTVLRGSSAVAVAEIQERRDVRLGAANELSKVWERLDKYELELEEIRSERLQLMEENRLVKEENRGLRYILSRMLMQINELRRNAGMSTLTDKDFEVPPG